MLVAEPLPLVAVWTWTAVFVWVVVVLPGPPVPPGAPPAGPPPAGPPPAGPPPVWPRTTRGLRANRMLVANANKSNRRVFMTATPTKLEKSTGYYQFVGT